MTPNPDQKEVMRGTGKSLLLSRQLSSPYWASPPTGKGISLAHFQIKTLKPREVRGSTWTVSCIVPSLQPHTQAFSHKPLLVHLLLGKLRPRELFLKVPQLLSVRVRIEGQQEETSVHQHLLEGAHVSC